MVLDRRDRSARLRGGFTLMEVVVVMAILVILASIGGVMYMRYLDDAKISKARIDVQTLAHAVDRYAVKYEGYPDSLQRLIQPPDGTAPYIEPSALRDPWGGEYQYQYPGQHNAALGKPDIWSNGPRAGDAASVIGNW